MALHAPPGLAWSNNQVGTPAIERFSSMARVLVANRVCTCDVPGEATPCRYTTRYTTLTSFQRFRGVLPPVYLVYLLLFNN